MAQRFLGGIFGNTVPSTADQPAISGVYDLNGQYYMSKEGGWEAVFSATGGTTVDYNSKRIHIFTSSGSFVATGLPGDCEYVVIGGGGSGGRANGGAGGGAG